MPGGTAAAPGWGRLCCTASPRSILPHPAPRRPPALTPASPTLCAALLPPWCPGGEWGLGAAAGMGEMQEGPGWWDKVMGRRTGSGGTWGYGGNGAVGGMGVGVGVLWGGRGQEGLGAGVLRGQEGLWGWQRGGERAESTREGVWEDRGCGEGTGHWGSQGLGGGMGPGGEGAFPSAAAADVPLPTAGPSTVAAALPHAVCKSQSFLASRCPRAAPGGAEQAGGGRGSPPLTHPMSPMLLPLALHPHPPRRPHCTGQRSTARRTWPRCSWVLGPTSTCER